MSHERARRRELRLAAGARRAAEARQRSARRTARRRRQERRRAALRAAVPWLPGQRWSRRTRAQRGTIGAALLSVLVLTYLIVPSWNVRIAVVLAALLVTPALVTLVLDRSTH